MKTGGFRYDDGTRYIGDWNQKGQKHGMGHLLLSGLLIKIFFHNSRNKISWWLVPDGTRYDGSFVNGVCSGLGIMNFPDGSK